MHDTAANRAPSKPVGLYPVVVPAHCHIPSPVLRDERLGANDKILYGRLRGYAGKNHHYCYVKIETLKQELNVSDRSLYRSISTLVSTGYIMKWRAHQRATTRYYFLQNDRIAHWLFANGKGGYAPPGL